MLHHTPLIATIVIGLVLAFALGAVANRLRISPLVGYLLAGVVAGPYTPGVFADTTIAPELAELGVILLMFGVGLHFSLEDLMSVKAIALPGAIVQIVFATALGMGLAWLLGWPIGAGVVFGLALSVASTVVLLRALQERHILDTERGKIAVGWLIVEDLAMVLTLVLLPALAGVLRGDAASGVGATDIAIAIGVTIVKVGAFIALMLVVGRRVIPWLLHTIAHTGSRELFRLCVLAVTLGVAYGSAQLFDVSFALGAFFAGMVMKESELSHQAANEVMPLRDAFAVLFFVSVGMLFDPAMLVRDFWPLLGVLFIILFGKSAAALLIVLVFRRPMATAFVISASLAQIGEFSFILAGLGVALDLLPERGRDLILAGAILSILLNPVAFALLDRLSPRLESHVAPAGTPTAGVVATTLTDHAVVVGYGRVGGVIGEALAERRQSFVVVEEKPEIVTRVRAAGIEIVAGPLPPAEIVATTNIAQARWLFVAIPNAFEAGQIVEQARRARADLQIIARAHSDAEVDYLQKLGADTTIMGEREIATAMVTRAFGSALA